MGRDLTSLNKHQLARMSLKLTTENYMNYRSTNLLCSPPTFPNDKEWRYAAKPCHCYSKTAICTPVTESPLLMGYLYLFLKTPVCDNCSPQPLQVQTETAVAAREVPHPPRLGSPNSTRFSAALGGELQQSHAPRSTWLLAGGKATP